MDILKRSYKKWGKSGVINYDQKYKYFLMNMKKGFVYGVLLIKSQSLLRISIPYSTDSKIWWQATIFIFVLMHLFIKSECEHSMYCYMKTWTSLNNHFKVDCLIRQYQSNLMCSTNARFIVIYCKNGVLSSNSHDHNH